MISFLQKNKLWVILGIVLLALIGITVRGNFFGAGSDQEITRYQTIGTAVAPLTLSNAYTGAGSVSGTPMGATGLANFGLAGTYTPKSHGSYVLLLVERSIDRGATYKPYMTITPETGDVLVNANGTSTTNGSPFIVPGNAIGTAASGTAISFSFDLTLLADFIRVRAKEITTSTAGTISAQSMISSN